MSEGISRVAWKLLVQSFNVVHGIVIIERHRLCAPVLLLLDKLRKLARLSAQVLQAFLQTELRVHKFAYLPSFVQLL